MAPDPRPGKPGEEGSARKEYHSPVLRVYGDIRTITQGNHSALLRDDGKSGRKTV
jgi:hypothetical protein